MPTGERRMRTTDDGDVAEATLAVVIPALDEEESIGGVVAAVPRRLQGVGRVHVVVVDDGSRDATRARALAAGADRVVSHVRNRGLVAAFNTGVREALALGADVVVHLDGDGQHDPQELPRLVAPIARGEADVVVGVRSFDGSADMSSARRHGNRLGSWVFRRLLHLSVSDVTSGYRAFSREALLRLNLVSDYTYTLETLIQAARKRLAVREVPISVRPRQVGTSRMTRSVLRYIGRTGGQAFRSILHANPLVAFGRAAVVAGVVAVAATGWFMVGYGDGGMHLPALLAAILSAIAAAGLFVSGLIADGISSNRRLLEDALYRLKELEALGVPVGKPGDATQPSERLRAAG